MPDFGEANPNVFHKFRRGKGSGAESKAAAPVDFGTADPGLFRRKSAGETLPKPKAIAGPTVTSEQEAGLREIAEATEEWQREHPKEMRQMFPEASTEEARTEAVPSPTPRVEAPAKGPVVSREETIETRAEAEPGPATAEEMREVVAEAVQETFEEQLRKLDPEQRKRYEAIVNNRSLLDKAADFAMAKLKGEKFAGVPLDFVVSFAGTTAARMLMRKSLETVFSLGGGAGMGAIIGGAFRGFREWRKGVKEQYSAASWIGELEGKDNVELAQTYEAIRLAIDQAKVKGDKEEALGLILKLRDLETRVALSRENAKPLSKLARLLLERGKAMATTDLTSEPEKIYRGLLNKRRAKVLKKTAIGVTIGAAIGAAGGALGHWAGEKLHDYFAGAPEVPKTGVGTAVREKALEKGVGLSGEALKEAKRKAMAEIIEKGIDNLPSREFAMHAQAGEGLTHIARNLIHDYLVEQHQLMPESKVELSQEQLIFAEDWLRRQFEDHVVQPGEGFTVKGEQIIEAISKAQALGEAQLANLKEHWVGKVGEKTWERMMDYGQNVEAANDVASEIKNQALAAADVLDKQAVLGQGAKGAVGAVKEGMQQRAERAGEKVAQQVARPEKKNEVLKYVVGGMLALGVGAVAIKYRKGIARGIGRAGEAIRTKVGGFEMPKFKMPEIRMPKFGKRTGEDKQREGARQAETSRAEQGVEPEQRGEQPELPPVDPEKLKADPLAQFAAKIGIKPELIEGLNYGIIPPEDVGKEKAGWLRFRHHSDYRKYLDEHFSPYRKAKALHYSLTGPLASEELWKRIDEGLDEETKNEYRSLYSQVKSGRAADGFTNKPEIKPKTREDIDKLEKDIREKFGIYVYSDYYSDDDGNFYAFEQLQKTLSNSNLSIYQLNQKNFKVDLKNTVAKDGNIHFDPDTPPEQMQKFLSETAIPESEKLEKMDREARKILHNALYEPHWITVSDYLGDNEKFLAGARLLAEAVRGVTFPKGKLKYIMLWSEDHSEKEDQETLVVNVNSSAEQIRKHIEEHLAKYYGEQKEQK